MFIYLLISLSVSVSVCLCLSVCLSLSLFRADKKIRHCRFSEENGQFTIGSATFDSMSELISYYEQNPLYRRMKLKYAINEEILRQIGQVFCQMDS